MAYSVSKWAVAAAGRVLETRDIVVGDGDGDG